MHMQCLECKAGDHFKSVAVHSSLWAADGCSGCSLAVLQNRLIIDCRRRFCGGPIDIIRRNRRSTITITDWMTDCAQCTVSLLHCDSSSATQNLISAAAAALADVAGVPPWSLLMWGTPMTLQGRREHAAKLTTRDWPAGHWHSSSPDVIITRWLLPTAVFRSSD